MRSGFDLATWAARWQLWIGILLGVFASGDVQGATFSATLDRNSVPLGESATLSLVFEGGTPKRIPVLQSSPNVTIQSLGESTQMTIENGVAHSTVSYNFQVTATQPGDYVIPSIQVNVDGQSLSSQPLKLKVIKSNGATSMAFLKLIPGKETVYLGETFPVELQLYLAVQGDNLQMPQIEGDGFIFGKIPQPTQGNTQVGNQPYHVVTFRFSAVAVKTGGLTLGPAQCSLVLQVPVNSRSRGFFDDFFGGIQRKQVTLSTEPQKVNVLPLPTDNRPPNFNGAVGSFSFVASARPTNLTAGDPITLRVQVVGQGNLDSLPFPGGTDWPQFKLYPPTSKVETTDPAGLSGVKTFERVVIPQSAEEKELPAIHFSFFDPERKVYRTLENPPLPISVHPSDSMAPEPTVLAKTGGTRDASPAARDIVHAKTYLGPITALQAPLVLQPWFLALQSLPVLTWLSALIWRQRREQLDKNPRLRRRLLVSEAVRKGMKSLARMAETDDSEAFFAAVFRLLQEQLGERLNLPASAITEAVLDERLREVASEELVGQLHQLFQVCNQARYAPQRSSQELMALVPTVETALSELRQLPENGRD